MPHPGSVSQCVTVPGWVGSSVMSTQLDSVLSSERWSHLCCCGHDRRLAMVVGSSLFILVTLVLLYGLMFLVAGIFLFTVNKNIQVGEI